MKIEEIDFERVVNGFNARLSLKDRKIVELENLLTDSQGLVEVLRQAEKQMKDLTRFANDAHNNKVTTINLIRLRLNELVESIPLHKKNIVSRLEVIISMTYL